jgi:hypothetical protein
MDTTHLAAIISVIVALSIASERLVEIVKGFIPFLEKQNPDATKEGHRRSALQILAVLSGIATAWLARDYIPQEIAEPAKGWAIIGLGLLASGGSGFWNSVLTYVTKVKDVKKLDFEEKKRKAPTDIS